MDVDAANCHCGQVGGEGFHVDQVAAHAVERIAGDGADFRQIEVIDAVADLLVAGEANSQRPMLDLRMFAEPIDGFHDDGHARLVVGPQQRSAVGGDQRPAAKSFSSGLSAWRITWFGLPGRMMSPPG